MHDAISEAYLDWFAQDDQQIADAMKWFSGIKRPAMGVRWGLGVYTGKNSTKKNYPNVNFLWHDTGPIGPDITKALTDRLDQKQFGPWPKFDHIWVPPVTIYSSGM